MVSMEITYTGNKRCEAIHGPSGAFIATDAPKDNAGLGEAFSPTDLVGVALGTCVITTIAIVAEREGLSLDIRGAKAKVTKEMQTSPRLIAQLTLDIQMPKGIPVEHRRRLEQVAHACPVHKSLHPDVKMPITITYPD